jgi:hypothetical protein
MPSVILSQPMYLQFWNATGTAPLVGGKLFTYAAASSTKQPTYTDYTGAVQNSNPIILDSSGVAVVWLDQSLKYKFVLAPANDTDPPTSPIRTVDFIQTQANLAYATDTGAVNAITGSVAGVFSYSLGSKVDVKVANTTTVTNPTLNINSIGPLLIVNQFGAPLYAGQIVAGGLYTFEHDGTYFRLLNATTTSSNTVVGTTGCSGATPTIYWTTDGFRATLEIRTFSATGSTTGFTITGLPVQLWPARAQFVAMPDATFTDGGSVLTITGSPGHGVSAGVGTNGTITFYKDSNSGIWTASGSRQISNLVFTYNLV